MGTPEPAAKCLKALLDAKFEVAAVITQPDRPKGRGLAISAPAVKELALTYNIAVYQPEKIKDKSSIELVKKIAPDLIVVVAYGKILPKEIIDSPKFGSINVHASLLPKFRGAAPIQWALINGEKETGITIQKVAFELDSGDIILQEKVSIAESDNISTLTKKLFEIGSRLLIKAVKDIEAGKVSYQKQDASKVSFAPTLKKETGQIDWKKSSREISNLVRGCDPWPVAFTYYKGKMLRIYSSETGLEPSKYEPGTVIDCVNDEGFEIACGTGSLFVKEVQLEGSKRMHAWQFMNGHELKVGSSLPS
jgi:methionyl-tRNA formyltransferase